MRAREPDRDGYVERDGVKVFYEVFGDDHSPTVLLLPTWSIVHSRRWKLQVPFLARRFRVITFDGRGNGRSDRPRTADAYPDTEFAADAAGVLDATGTDRVVVVGMSMGAGYALRFAGSYPDRTLGAVFVGPTVGLADPVPGRTEYPFDEVLDTDEGWAKRNRHYWLRDWPGYNAFFWGQVFNEPHSTKQIDDAIDWGLETDPETMLLIEDAPYLRPDDTDRPAEAPPLVHELIAKIYCPCLVVHGTNDAVVDVSGGRRLAEALGCPFVAFDGNGHAPDAREPVRFNLLVRNFVDAIAPREPPPSSSTRTWTRSLARPKRALFLSSPIGLGHALRDVAIARELRTLDPDLRIDWLAQHPVTTVLEARGERVHPASAWLASESAHIESEAGEHDLRVFSAFRDMDEILVANFHVFHDVVDAGAYDLVVGDESWDVDHFLHENPELKRTAFVWMTDFVGWLPMPEGGEREASLTADYNAEMIEHVERFPRLRDRAIFVGDPEDLPPGAFGPDLPGIRDWVEAHYAFSGYVTGFDPVAIDREAVRAELGYRPDERVCLVTVGGSGVGEHLLRRAIAAYPEAKRAAPELRMVVVAGPRIDPSSLPSHDGSEIHGYLDGLYRHMAAADVAIVQGGLTTTMELAALGTPFVYVPLRGHFEQNLLVPRRLERYGAGRRVDYDDATPEALGQAIAAGTRAPARSDVGSRTIGTDGARRAADMIAELL